MHSDLEVLADPSAVARAAAAYVADRLAAVADHGASTRVSGGHTPWAMLAELPRTCPGTTSCCTGRRTGRPPATPTGTSPTCGEPGEAPADVVAMPVGGRPGRSAATYAARLPERLDLIHLGLGPDGHTASLVPGDPVLDVTDRLVAVTEPYQAHRRMTLTYPTLARADQLLWLITGADKRDPLRRMLAGDPTIPAGRVEAARSLVLADAAAGGTTTTDQGASA